MSKSFADVPVNLSPRLGVSAPGDCDGDGKADVAVWRESESVWYVKGSRDGAVMVKAHGSRGDIPVIARSKP